MQSQYLVLLFLLFSFRPVSAQHEDYALLWEISGNGLTRNSYLFGSLHQNGKEFFDFPDSLYLALDQAQTIVLETDIFEFSEQYAPIIRQEVELTENGIYARDSDGSDGAYGAETGMPQFLDAYFEQYAFNAGKEFFPLETIEFQTNLMSEVSFGGTASRLSLALISQEDIMRLYARGDIETLSETIKAALAGAGNFYEKLITERNVGMARRLDSLLSKQESPLFCAVGAGHLGGKTGVISLLRAKGYTLRKVHYNREPDSPSFKKNVLAARSYTYHSPESGFEITFGGKPGIEENDDDLKLVYVEFGQGNFYRLTLSEAVTTDPESLVDSYFIDSPELPVEILTEDSLTIINGYTRRFGNLSAQRLVLQGERLFLLSAYGGTRFMASGRAAAFFDRFKLIP